MLDTLRGPIKAAVAALFAVGLLLSVPQPALAVGRRGDGGAGAAAALALTLLTAWAFVAMTGRDAMPEHEFERLVRRSEELAREPDLRAATRPSST